MQILAVDIGTGTQDILLFPPGLSLENAFKLVMPSPTMIIRRRIQQATQRQEALLLTGVMMGGGPSHWAAEEHLQLGLPLFATPEAGRTFKDDLDWVEHQMGVQLVSPDEATKLGGVTEIALSDFDLPAIRLAFESFGISLAPAVVAAAVFDHGAAPPDVSDRQFRFDYLARRILDSNRLTAFAYLSDAIPASMTRMQAVALSAGRIDCPLVVMDTAPAAILGATLDPLAASQPRRLIANIGNFHTLAFRLSPEGIEGVFEHHTGLIDRLRLEHLLLRLADSTLLHEEVFNDHGHGAWVHPGVPAWRLTEEARLVVTGPRRALMTSSSLQPHLAVPFGDMMLAGCFGLLMAAADLVPAVADPIQAALAGGGVKPPWEVGQL